MKTISTVRTLSIGTIFLVWLTACSTEQSQSPAGQARTGGLSESEVAAIVREYFDHFAAYDYLSMRAMSTPTFETHDHGLRLSHPEFEDWVRNTAEIIGATIEFDVSQFNTSVGSEFAHTNFLLTIDISVSDEVLREVFGEDAEPPPQESSLSAMFFVRSDDQWLIDRLFMSSVSQDPEALIRIFYHHVKAYNYEGMRAMVTPGFRAIYDGTSLDWEGFEQRHRAEEAELGPASSRPQRFLYRLSDFESEESTPNVVNGTIFETASEEGEDNRSLSFVLRRIESRWLIDSIGSMQAIE